MRFLNVIRQIDKFNFLIGKEGDVRTDLMKLKLLIPTSTPIQLSQKLDDLLEDLLGRNNE